MGRVGPIGRICRVNLLSRHDRNLTKDIPTGHIFRKKVFPSGERMKVPSDQAPRSSNGWVFTRRTVNRGRRRSSLDQAIDCPSASPSKAVPTGDRTEMRPWSISASCG